MFFLPPCASIISQNGRSCRKINQPNQCGESDESARFGSIVDPRQPASSAIISETATGVRERARPLSSLMQMTPDSGGAQHGSPSAALRPVWLLRMASMCPRSLSLSRPHTHASLQPVAVIFRRDPSLLSFRSVPVNSPCGCWAICHKHAGGQRFNYL